MTQNAVTNYEEVTWLNKNLFFAVFHRSTSNLRGTLVENINKSKMGPLYRTAQFKWQKVKLL
jgi:hypothetical protein